MRNDRVTTFSSDPAENLYPHMKITAETYPRVLATRRIEADGAEYFGPFLPRTSARLLIDLLNRTFRLRTCDIPIDGTFPVPCTQYYRKRCLAPCVASICSRDEYLASVDFVRLFLADQREELIGTFEKLIAAASEDLEFEQAAKYRDTLEALQKWWSDQRLDIWLADSVDTITVESRDGASVVYLVTQRNRYVLGRKVFTFPDLTPEDALADVISRFYLIGLPREIRVYRDFPARGEVEAELSERFGKVVRIRVVRRIDERVTARRALHITRSENEIDRIRPHMTALQIADELKRIFGLAEAPRRIAAFDVAHISGSAFVAASSVWVNGEFVSAEARFEISEQTSELTALAHFVDERTTNASFDLVVLDGGKPQLNAVSASVTRPVNLVAAVKPRGRHSAVSHFIRADGWEIGFDPDNAAHAVLLFLRDEAHDLSNRVHRDLRDMGHHYELAALLPSLTESERREVVSRAGTIKRMLELSEDELADLLPRSMAKKVITDLHDRRSRYQEITTPLIVPLRYTAPNGNAADLIPIDYK